MPPRRRNIDIDATDEGIVAFINDRHGYTLDATG